MNTWFSSGTSGPQQRVYTVLLTVEKLPHITVMIEPEPSLFAVQTAVPVQKLIFHALLTLLGK